MKKSLLILLSLTIFSVILSSCSTLTAIDKEKTEDGFIQSNDLVYKTTKIEHPSLVPAFDVGKYNLFGNKQFENIQAYILDNVFYLEADYGNKPRKALYMDTIMFFTTRNKIEFKTANKDLTTYYNFDDFDGLRYENLKVVLTPEEINLLGRFLIADEVYIAFAGDRGRTDLFKISNKVKKSMLELINKWNKLNNQPEIEMPKPEPKVAPAEEENKEETVSEDEKVVEAAEESETSDKASIDENTNSEKPELEE